ncbi:MAG: hypothetical protein RIT81_42090 [Deltaproteobacteria bacterium]
MKVRRERETTTPVRETRSVRATAAPDVRATADVTAAPRSEAVRAADEPPIAAALRPDPSIRTSTSRVADDTHRRTLELAAQLRDEGRTDEALGLLRGLRFLTPSRGVPDDATFLAGRTDASSAGEGLDRLDAMIASMRDEPIDTTIQPALRLSWFNDQFFYPNGDDDGFTQAAELGLTLRRGVDQLDLDVRHSMLTERGGPRRVDELDVHATLSRTIERGQVEWTFGPKVGVSLVGDYGGAELQDWFHGAIGMGRRLDGWLQSEYEGTNQAAVIVGAHVQARRDLGVGFSAHAGLDGQLALGPTGVSRIAPRVGLNWELPRGPVRPVVGAELEIAKFHTPDARLQMAGGYDTSGFQAMPNFRLGIAGDHFELGWRGTVNQGGSGANMGEIYLTIGRR